ncbi:MAG: radical SAM protein [Myxococcales bacterium]|nr:radical SAM protein [Myxococcales bacterium]
MAQGRGSRRLDVLRTSPHPAYVVWELTLACDHACRHCGSRAAQARPHELTTADALDVVRQLGAMGTREVVLIGGEAYLHDGFLDIIRALRAEGIQPSMTTGGFGVTRELAEAMADAGLQLASVSVDGLEATHDRQRARAGSYRGALAALAHLRDVGIATASNINVNRLNLGELEPLYDVLRGAGVRAWQVQITAPLGRAADRPEMLLQPWDLLELVPRLVALKRRAKADGIDVWPGNNLGYFGPEEGALRSADPDDASEHWRGCQAGKFVLGIESDGAVKGCPSLLTASYVGGHLGERTLASIWDESPELAFARGPRKLWGYCAECAYAEPCQGGCSFTAHAVLGRPGNNPLCYHRARVYRRQGLRERLVPTEAAEGRPFDHGLYRVELEPFDAPDPVAPPRELVRIGRKPRFPEPGKR